MITFNSLKAMGRPIAYYPKLAKPLGGVNACVLFSQLLYWHDKTDDALGVYKTIEQLEEETGLTKREQMAACEKLQALGILTKTHKRLQHRMYYKLNEAAFDQLMAQYAENAEFGEATECDLPKEQKRTPRSNKSALREVTNAHLDEVTKAHLDIRTLDYQENTNIDYKQSDGDVVGTTSQHNAVLPAQKSTMAQTKKPDTAQSKPKPDALALLKQFGIEGQLAEDYIAHRKAKRSTVSVTVLQSLQEEAEKCSRPSRGKWCKAGRVLMRSGDAIRRQKMGAKRRKISMWCMILATMRGDLYHGINFA